MFLLKSKPKSHSVKVLEQLRRSGKYGAFNHDLAKPNVGGLAYHRRITDLRKAGYVIDRVRITQAKHKYYLVEEAK